MVTSPRETPWSFQCTLVFWWLIFLALQQTQRLFLLLQALSVEVPREGILIKTLITGLRADLITATLGIGVAVVLAGVLGTARIILGKFRNRQVQPFLFARILMGTSIVVALVLFVILTIDMGYFGYNGQHLDFVFLEYLRDVLDQTRGQNQAALQTQAELGETQKWVVRLLGYLALEGAALTILWYQYRRRVRPLLDYWISAWPRTAPILGVLTLVATATGLHPDGWWSIQKAGISNSMYYTLAQNPVLYTSGIIHRGLQFHQNQAAAHLMEIMPLDEAVQKTWESIGPEENFPYSQFPYVRKVTDRRDGVAQPPPNILLIFVEGLDRRFLGRHVKLTGTSLGRDEDLSPQPVSNAATTSGATEDPVVHVTPFLDRFKMESLFFEHFFSNGTKTDRGLFATLCSCYPSRGWSVMKTRYTYDFLCLPSILSRGGYRTEMVIGQNRDRGHEHMGMFLARNGLEELFDESDFPPTAERLGLGMTDAALFDLVRTRIETLQNADRPFFLATLTVGTHHPFTVPLDHPDVRALQQHPDKYLAALRYLDLAFERFFEGLLQDGLLQNTMVFVLGDHGRHERKGKSENEVIGGRFLAPLFIWLDASLRTPENFSPRVVATVASQVDVAPTILGLTGLMPRLVPFLGRDLSCLLRTNCIQRNMAFLSNVYDNVIGLADQQGIALYSYPRDKMYLTDLSLNQRELPVSEEALDVSTREGRLLALDISSNVLLEQNRIWSWREFGDKL